MNDENKFASDHSDVESRVFAFRSCMEPALHLFPENIVERLKGDGFFTAPASTKYHGAYEGGLFEHSLNVTISLVDSQSGMACRGDARNRLTSSACSMIFANRTSTGILLTRLSMVAVPRSLLLMKANGNTTLMRFSKGTGRSR